MSDTPHLTIIRGLPGSGKSTLAKAMVTADAMEGMEKLLVHLEADQFHLHDNGDYHYDADLARYAHSWCISKTVFELRRDKNVVVANTFITQDEVSPYLSIAHTLGATVSIISCQGSFGTIHGVPDDVIEKMKRNWEEVDMVWPRPEIEKVEKTLPDPSEHGIDR